VTIDESRLIDSALHFRAEFKLTAEPASAV
jgi:hypothetical protein